ncbi:MAG: bifunctional allantoicase/(S)-ureidoglycine aminohydrolase [Pseudomonadota bacterium]
MMKPPIYQTPPGGLPGQDEPLSGKAIFTEAYAVIPHGVLRDIVTSKLPHWHETRLWIIARPMTGFAETFSQYIMEVGPGGGSENPEPDENAEAVLFVLDGALSLSLGGEDHDLSPGGFAYIPPGKNWAVANNAKETASFHWIRKKYRHVEGVGVPEAVIGNENDLEAIPMAGSEGRWSTKRFLDPDDIRFDMHVNIVSLEPGACIPFLETHVMEHGLYVLEGKGVYRLNRDWVEVEAGDFMWLLAFCPQACYAGGPGRFS